MTNGSVETQTYEAPSIEDCTPIDRPLIGGPTASGAVFSAVFRPL